MESFERLESGVRSYSRTWPAVFATAAGAWLQDESGRRYLDFFSGAGTLNYGHSPADLKRALVAYVESDGITHGLDMATTAKRAFLERFDEVILRPRGLDYRMQFPGPTGTNAVEAALKLARKVTGRRSVIAFTHGFHGMTLGALAVSASQWKRQAAGVPLADVATMPYDGFLGDDDTISHIDAYLQSAGDGDARPAAMIVETVQGEGGLHAASYEWLARLRELCDRTGALLIVDDVQVGCGRTGPFFSFEPAGVVPDIVCLSKSLSGSGLPMALVLIKPEIDVWNPGEHSGTFRGNNPAFVTATAALDRWQDDRLTREVQRKSGIVTSLLSQIAATYEDAGLTVRGRGLIQGLACSAPEVGRRVVTEAFARGLVLETSGPRSEVAKILPPLTIDDADLVAGCELLGESMGAALHGANVAVHKRLDLTRAALRRP